MAYSLLRVYGTAYRYSEPFRVTTWRCQLDVVIVLQSTLWSLLLANHWVISDVGEVRFVSDLPLAFGNLRLRATCPNW